ncbi:hypothetical protein FIC82_003695 [Cellulosimicrobium protaetiae]|uniref:Uncharacterized protein n=1 Tax=Cellulosimicrobium protaetiae TaxID=2587808 RepID=A0A6M5UJK4_9MICO|nr:hypothetical protein FIC82_003695 [Cellulosimicrobium protaetiae]
MSSRRSGARALLDRWPGVLGLVVAAALLAVGAGDRDTLAIGVTAAASCYLAAGALGRPWVAWAAIPGASLVIVAARLADVPWWAGLGLAALVLVVLGLRRGAARPTLVQGAALLAYGGLAVLALAIDPRAGLVLAGLTLAVHAVWDVVHHRRGEVVPRSMAEACIGFDVVLGLGAIVLAATG